MAVPSASTVSVLVIDCTRTGASPPTVTCTSCQDTVACKELRRGAGPKGRQAESGAVRISIILIIIDLTTAQFARPALHQPSAHEL